MADRWYGTWQQMRTRRDERIKQRAAGMPRSTSWFGRVKQRVQLWWDRSTTRVDNRHQARAVRDHERLQTTRWQRFRERLTGQTPVAYPNQSSTPKTTSEEADEPAGKSATAGDQKPGNDTATDGRKPATDPGHSLNGDRPDNTPRHTAGTNPSANGRHNPQEEQVEVTGLSSAVNYAQQQQQAHDRAVTDCEGFAAALSANEVSGEALTEAQRAMELEQQTAAAWQRAHTALSNHMGVKEAYDANPDAGNKQFVTSE